MQALRGRRQSTCMRPLGNVVRHYRRTLEHAAILEIGGDPMARKLSLLIAAATPPERLGGLDRTLNRRCPSQSTKASGASSILSRASATGCSASTPAVEREAC